VYSPLARLLHDGTADKIAAVISQIPHAAATIVPFDVRRRVSALRRHGMARDHPVPGMQADPEAAGPETADGQVPRDAAAAAAAATAVLDPGPDAPVPAEPAQADSDHYSKPAPPAWCTPIGTLTKPGRAVVEGRIRAVEIRPVQQNTVLACAVSDSSGQITALFYGRSHIPGLQPGAMVRLRGPVGIRDGHAVMINPAYELLAPGTGGQPST
jgi:hypothetical protein